MPGTRGDDFLVELRIRRPQITSILLTGQADPQAVQRVLTEAKVAAVLHKPWRAEDLRELIERHAVEGSLDGSPA